MLKSLTELNAAAYQYQLAVEDKLEIICEPLRHLVYHTFVIKKYFMTNHTWLFLIIQIMQKFTLA